MSITLLAPIDESTGMRRISNSETSAFLQCERKWYYQYVLELAPLKHSDSLSRGIIGHECLAIYYQALKDGDSYTNAETAATAHLMQYFTNDFEHAMLSGLMALLQSYFVFARNDEWKILEVETEYDLPIRDNFSYPMRIDLLVRMKDGRTALIDHKFVYDFYSQDVLDMNFQLPKYKGAIQAITNEKVDVIMLNQIRHRLKKGPMTNEERFRRSELYVAGTEIRTIMEEQIRASDRIMALRDNPRLEFEILRTPNQMTCKNCPMLRLCKADLMGSDTTLMRQVDYKINDGYGYNKLEEELV